MTKSKTIIICFYGVTIGFYLTAVGCLLISNINYVWVVLFLGFGSLTDLYLNHYQEKHSNKSFNAYQKRNR